MFIDQISLQLVLALVSACIGVVLFAGWMISRTDRFMLTGAAGLAVLVLAAPVFVAYIDGPRPHLALPAFALFLIGLSTIEAGGRQFRLGGSPYRRIAVVSLGSIGIIAPFFLTGIDGVGISLFNFLACAILVSAGLHYWRARGQASVLLPALTGLYVLVGLSFLMAGVVVVIESPIYRVRTPNNWAENLNALVAIIGLAGIGAISLALNQFRLVQSLRVDARTDPLTGLKNRRVLFETYGEGALPVGTAVAIFDLDHFKKVNDQHGHAVGDAVLMHFAKILTKHSGRSATVARTGGEEFVLVLESAPVARAQRIVDDIREALARSRIDAGAGFTRCTVSAGIAFATEPGSALDKVLHEADQALYLAKRSGRDRVVVNALPAAA